MWPKTWDRGNRPAKFTRQLRQVAHDVRSSFAAAEEICSGEIRERGAHVSAATTKERRAVRDNNNKKLRRERGVYTWHLYLLYRSDGERWARGVGVRSETAPNDDYTQRNSEIEEISEITAETTRSTIVARD